MFFTFIIPPIPSPSSHGTEHSLSYQNLPFLSLSIQGYHCHLPKDPLILFSSFLSFSPKLPGCSSVQQDPQDTCILWILVFLSVQVQSVTKPPITQAERSLERGPAVVQFWYQVYVFFYAWRWHTFLLFIFLCDRDHFLRERLDQ